jgi:hypothetical protein
MAVPGGEFIGRTWMSRAEPRDREGRREEDLAVLAGGSVYRRRRTITR